MKFADHINEEQCDLISCMVSWQSTEMGCFGKSVDHHLYDGVPVRLRKPGNEIEGQVFPHIGRYRQGVK